MDTKSSAKLAEMAYEIGNTARKEDRNKMYGVVDQHLENEKINYKVVPEHSNRNITTYVDKANPKNIHISHKGTALQSHTGGRDLMADISIALGMGGDNKHIKKRRKQTDRILDKMNPDSLTMSSHSLGGFTQNHTIAKSKKVRDKLLQADTFNAGANPFSAKSKKVRDKLLQADTFNAGANPFSSNDLDLSKNAKKELKGVPITHHRTRNDVVSKGLKDILPFGDLKEYKLRPTQYEKEHDNIFEKGINEKKEKLKDKNALEKMSFGSKALYAHHLHHFSDRVLDPVEKNKKKKSKKLKGHSKFSV
jgi:hypothetical protein